MPNGTNYNERPFMNYERKSFPVSMQSKAVTQEQWDAIFSRCDECGESKGECQCSNESSGSEKTAER